MGRRPVGLPPQIVTMLEKHREAQEVRRKAARQLWVATWETEGWIFTDDRGQPVNPWFDYDE